MASNIVTVHKSTAQTQAGSFVDTVTFQDSGDMLWCDNRSSTVNIWITWGSSGAPATPSAGADGALYVPAGSFRSWPLPRVSAVKIFGDAVAMTYVVGVI